MRFNGLCLVIFAAVALSIRGEIETLEDKEENIAPNESEVYEAETSLSGSIELPVEYEDVGTSLEDALHKHCIEQQELESTVNKYEETLKNQMEQFEALNVTYSVCSSSLASTTIQLIQTENNASSFDVHLRLAKNEIAIAKVDVEHCLLDKDLKVTEFNETVKRLLESADQYEELVRSRDDTIEKLTIDLDSCKSSIKTTVPVVSGSIQGSVVIVELVQWAAINIQPLVVNITNTYFNESVIEQLPGYTMIKEPAFLVYNAVVNAVKERVMPIVVHLLGFLVELVGRILLLFKYSVSTILNNVMKSTVYLDILQPVGDIVLQNVAVVYTDIILPAVNSALIETKAFLNNSKEFEMIQQYFGQVVATLSVWRDVIVTRWNKETSYQENMQLLAYYSGEGIHSVLRLVHYFDTIPEIHELFGDCSNLAIVVTVTFCILMSLLICLLYKTVLVLVILMGIYIVSPQCFVICVLARLIVLFSSNKRRYENDDVLCK